MHTGYGYSSTIALLGGLVGTTVISMSTALASEVGPALFEANTLIVDDLIGTLSVSVGDDDAISVMIDGPDKKVQDISVSVECDALVIKRGMGATGPSERLVLSEYPRVNVTVPSRTPLTSATNVKIEKRGSGDVTIGMVRGTLFAELPGSGDVDVGPSGLVEIRKRGTGDVAVGPVAGPFTYRSAGIGDVDVQSVDGPVDVASTSNGKIHIHGGTARPDGRGRGVWRFYPGWRGDRSRLTVTGASIIKLRFYTGIFKAAGHGDIRVNGNRVYPLERF